MILPYAYSPILVDLADFTAHGTRYKRRASRVNVQLPENAAAPCRLLVEVIPYARLRDGSYGEELSGGNFHRQQHPLTVNNNRLVDAQTGRILATRYQADGQRFRPDADWQSDVARLAADESVVAMYQADWFCKIMREVPAVVDEFIIQYIRLADASGDLA